MSWPIGAAGVWPLAAGGTPAAGGQDMAMMMGQYTPEQWAAMQQQNWQQWTQWQQQYAQWQSQYGDKYAAIQAMQAAGGTGDSAAPPLPTSQPNKPAPPPPDKPPPPPYENNQPLFQAGANVPPVPPVPNAMVQGNHQAKDNARGPYAWDSNRQGPAMNANPKQNNWNNQKQANWNAQPKQGDWNANPKQGDWNANAKQGDWNKHPKQDNWNVNPKQADWKANNANSWSGDGTGPGKNAGFDRNQQKSWGETVESEINSEALKKHGEEERLFDVQFQKWEEEFEKWKQQNVNHPDKKAYADYEQKFETCRAQLMERRQQMKLKRLKLMGHNSQPEKIEPCPPAPPANKDIQMQPKSYNRYEQPPSTAAQYQDNSQYDRHDHVSMENSNDSFNSNSNSNFLSSSEQRKGIPGLDLVEEDSTKDLPLKDDTNVIDITDDPSSNNKDNFSAISKGINNILGDQKILNILSMVQGQKMHPNNSMDSLRNMQMQENSPNNFGRNVNANKPYNMSGPNSGHNNNTWTNQNFQNQTFPNKNMLNQHFENDVRDGSMSNRPNLNNAQVQQGPRYNNMPLGQDLPPLGRTGDHPLHRGKDFSEGPNFENSGLHSGPGHSDFPRHPDAVQRNSNFPQGHNYNSGDLQPGPGRPNFPSHPDTMQRGDYPHGPNYGAQSRPGRLDPHSDSMQRGNDFPQGSDFNSNPQLRPGRPDLAPRPETIQRGNDFEKRPNYNNSGDPQFVTGRSGNSSNPDERQGGDDFQHGPNYNRGGLHHGPGRSDFPPNTDIRSQEFHTNPLLGRPNMGINPNARQDMGPPNSGNIPGSEMRRNAPDMGIQRPDMFMTQERGRGYIPDVQQDRMGPNVGMQPGPNQRGPSQSRTIPPLMGTNVQQDINKGPNPMMQGPLASAEKSDFKWELEPILEPSVIVDYQHKPLRMKVRDFIEPVQTFDYNHISNTKDFKGDSKPGDRWSELDTYNQRSGTKVIDYQNRSLNDLPANLGHRGRYDREYPDRRDEPSERHDRLSDRYDDRRRDDRRDERRRDERPDDRRRDDRPDDRRRDERPDDRRRDERPDDRRRDDRPDDRRRDERARYDRHRSPPDVRSQEQVGWSRDRGRERDTRKRERSKDKLRDPSIDSIKSAKINEKTISPSSNASSHIVMIDDLLESPGREVRPEKLVIILRGVPGSGKSYLAKLIKDKEMENGGSAPRILSIDDYFIQETELEEKDPTTGKMFKKASMKYVYDENQEENYLNSLKRAFKRTVTDQFFPFIIVDAVNCHTKHYAEFYNFGRQHDFQAYVCTLECDSQTAFKRNTHGRTLDEVEVLAARFVPTPKHFTMLDASTLLQSAAIQEVHMEDVVSDDDVIMEDAMAEPEEPTDQSASKWERMEDSDQLARLDGTSKRLRPSQYSLDEYLQLDDWQPQRTAQPGKKTVRWADIEERREQEKMRAIGFVVGQTDWNRMTDPTLGSGALTQMKYIERARRPYT